MFVELKVNPESALTWGNGVGHVIKEDVLSKIMTLTWFRQSEKGKLPVVDSQEVIEKGLSEFIMGGVGDNGRGEVSESSKRWDEGRFEFYTTR